MPKKANTSSKKKSKKTDAEIPALTAEIQAPYHFDDLEKLEMSRLQNEDLRLIGELEEQKKASAQDFKLRIEQARNRVSQLQNKLTAGYETRPLQAIVKLDDPKTRQKTYYHPATGERIRTEDMTAADFQTEMFNKQDITKPTPGGEVETKPKGRKSKKEPGANAGQTNVGDALGRAAAFKDQPKFVFDIEHSKQAYDSATDVYRAVKEKAKVAGWDKAAISLLVNQLKTATTMEAMYAILAPHVTATEPPSSETAAEAQANRQSEAGERDGTSQQ